MRQANWSVYWRLCAGPLYAAATTGVARYSAKPHCPKIGLAFQFHRAETFARHRKPVPFIGGENAKLRSPINRGNSAMQERVGFKETDKQRLSEEAAKLRDEALGTPPGVERERLLRRAQEAEFASQLNGWLNSPGLQPPK